MHVSRGNITGAVLFTIRKFVRVCVAWAVTKRMRTADFLVTKAIALPTRCSSFCGSTIGITVLCNMLFMGVPNMSYCFEAIAIF